MQLRDLRQDLPQAKSRSNSSTESDRTSGIYLPGLQFTNTFVAAQSFGPCPLLS